MDSNQRYGFPYCLARSQRLAALTFSVKSGQRFGKFVQGRRSLMAHWRKSWDKAQLIGEFLVDRDGIVRWSFTEADGMGQNMFRARSRGGHIRGVRRRALEAFGGTASPKRDTLDASAAAGERPARDLVVCRNDRFTSRRSSAASKLGRRRGGVEGSLPQGEISSEFRAATGPGGRSPILSSIAERRALNSASGRAPPPMGSSARDW